MKETLRKVKRQPSEWEKIIANEATDKQLNSKIYKQLLQGVWRKGTPFTLLAGMQTSTATMENSVEIP